MLFKMAVDNLRRNFRNYWAYFFSSAFSAFVLYLFLSVTFNNVIAGNSMVMAFKAIFIIGTFLTACFTAFFIWYSNSFFIKSRKKEFATYMLLGMSQKQTARLNFVENLVILLLSFDLGIAAGLLLNKLLIMLLLSIMRIQAYVPFEISWSALKVCAGIFAGVFVLISIHSASLIKKNTLINLMNASKKAEQSLKVSALTYVIGAASLVLIGSGYYLSVKWGTSPALWFPIVGLVCAGTVLLFTYLATLFIHFSKKDRARLYNGTRLITSSQLSYRYKGNIGVLSTIAITTSVALCALLACCGLFGKTADNSRGMRPYSAEYVKSKEADAAFSEILKAHDEIRVKFETTVALLPVTTAGTEKTLYLLSESNYKEICTGLESNGIADLKEDSDCVSIKRNSISLLASNNAENTVAINTGSGSTTFNITDRVLADFISLDKFTNTLVVRNRVYEQIKNSIGSSEYLVAGYLFTNETLSQSFIDDLRDKLPEGSKPLTYYSHYMDKLKLMGVMLFAGVFIGLLFISATGSILYFRMSTEAIEDRDKYTTLLKIGVSSKELRKAIAKEVGIVFAAPFAVAIFNSFAALFPLEKFANLNLKDVYAIIILSYALLYGFYYWLTVNKYNRTVNRHS